MMRRPERTHAPAVTRKTRDAERLHGRRLEGFGLRHGRQKPREPECQHGFASARRSHEQQRVPSRGSDFQCPLRLQLTLDVQEVERLRGCYGQGG